MWSRSSTTCARRVWPFPGKDDPHARLTHAEFLARAWKLANDKAASWGGSCRGRCSRNIARCKILSTGSARQSGPRLGYMACMGTMDRVTGGDLQHMSARNHESGAPPPRADSQTSEDRRSLASHWLEHLVRFYGQGLLVRHWVSGPYGWN
jgi:hypothetical protein